MSDQSMRATVARIKAKHINPKCLPDAAPPIAMPNTEPEGNFRNYTDRELAELASDRLETIRWYVGCGANLWAEVLYRLQRSAGVVEDAGPDTRKTLHSGKRQGILLLGSTRRAR